MVGCCGWPEARPRYFADFPAVELQTTFYEPPTPALAAKWRASAPAEFQFCLKAWQVITHTPNSPTYRRLRSRLDPEKHGPAGWFRPSEQVWLAWERTREIARVVDARVILFQCPASFRPTPENVRHFRGFFGRLAGHTSILAWEPRGEWAPELIGELCAELNLVHCVDPFLAKPVYGRCVYYRLHGRGGYRYEYSDAELASLEEKVRLNENQGRGPIYVLFNNMSMRTDALRFQARFNS